MTAVCAGNEAAEEHSDWKKTKCVTLRGFDVSVRAGLLALPVSSWLSAWLAVCLVDVL